MEFLRDASLDWPVPGRSIAGVAVVFAPGCHPPGRDPFRWPPSHAPPLIAPVRVNPFRNATQVNPLRCGSARISLRGARNPARISAGNQYDRWRANYQPRVRVGRGGGIARPDDVTILPSIASSSAIPHDPASSWILQDHFQTEPGPEHQPQEHQPQEHPREHPSQNRPSRGNRMAIRATPCGSFLKFLASPPPFNPARIS